MTGPLLVAVDGSPKTKALLDAAITFAKQLAAPVKVLHLRELEAYGRGGIVWDETPEQSAHELEEAVTLLRDAGVDATGMSGGVGSGAVARAIVEYAQEAEAQAIMVGTKGHNRITELLVGSTTYKLLHLIDRPLIVIP